MRAASTARWIVLFLLIWGGSFTLACSDVTPQDEGQTESPTTGETTQEPNTAEPPNDTTSSTEPTTTEESSQETINEPSTEPVSDNQNMDASETLPEEGEGPQETETPEESPEPTPEKSVPEPAPETTGPQPPSCKNKGSDCLQTTTTCKQGSCTTKTTTKKQSVCDVKSGLCKLRCSKHVDCGKPTCSNSSSTTCQQTLPQCIAGRCANSIQRKVSGAACERTSGFCRYKVNRCQESQDGAKLCTAIYPSEPLSAAPSTYKLIKQYTGTGKNGVMFFYTSRGTHTLCHYVFKGVSPKKIQDLIASLTSAKRTNCSTSGGRGMGSCGVGFYDQYNDLRKSKTVSDLLTRVNNWGCPGGIRIYGHSMGGALASLLAVELYLTNATLFNTTNMRVYTYGTPRVFFKSAADNHQGKVNVLRWVHDGDPVPSVPPTALDFKHFGDAYEVKRSNGKLKYKKEGQNYSPSISILNPTDSHKYTTYDQKLKDCSL